MDGASGVRTNRFWPAPFTPFGHHIDLGSNGTTITYYLSSAAKRCKWIFFQFIKRNWTKSGPAASVGDDRQDKSYLFANAATPFKVIILFCFMGTGAKALFLVLIQEARQSGRYEATSIFNFLVRWNHRVYMKSSPC